MAWVVVIEPVILPTKLIPLLSWPVFVVAAVRLVKAAKPPLVCAMIQAVPPDGTELNFATLASPAYRLRKAPGLTYWARSQSTVPALNLPGLLLIKE